MPRERVWNHVSRKLVILLLGVAVPPAGTLVWLGFQLFAQDRALMTTVIAERRRTETQAVVNALDQAVVDAERLLAGGALPEGIVRLTFAPDRAAASPADRVLWLPVSDVDRAEPAASFDDAERLEYRGSIDGALAIYEERARVGSRSTRAAALLRLARVHRQARHWDAAIEAYGRLTAFGRLEVIDAPADLQARRAIVSLLEDAGRDVTREATALRADFVRGRWSLDRAAWELTAKDITEWTGEPVPRPAGSELFSHVADHLWPLLSSSSAQPAARSIVVVGGVPVTVLTRTSGDGRTTIAILPAVIGGWLQRASTRADVAPGRARLVHGDMTVAGTTGVGDVVTASAVTTGLPWTVVVAHGDTSADAHAFDRRRRQLSLALVAILALLAGGSYFLWRVMQRELAVSRLQTEFVAAVSHEFRTPLTSLRHVSDLLEENDDVPKERRSALYGVLGRNVERLHRLVESLLDFSRMEGGRKPYDLQPLDAAELVTRVVHDFRRDALPAGFEIHLDVESSGPLMSRADAASLTNAVWNLLDNAVKYSPGGRQVQVSVRRREAGVAIAVRDEGLGIPVREQKEIFRRFVRGENARQRGIKGTGLGLAMVAHIAEAHHGRVEIESKEGEGSTFRIVLPSLA